MKTVAFEVEENIVSTERLEGDDERRRKGGQSSSSYDSEIDELASMIEFFFL